jgi:hypothetical protein
MIHGELSYTDRVICKVLQGVCTGPQFSPNWGQNQKTGWRWIVQHWEKRGPNWSTQEFHPQFWICITCVVSAAHILSLIQSHQIKSLQVLVLWTGGTQLHSTILNFTAGYPPKKKEEPEPVSHFCDVVKLSNHPHEDLPNLAIDQMWK